MSERSLAGGDVKESRIVNRIFASWNQIGEWLRRLDAVRRTA